MKTTKKQPAESRVVLLGQSIGMTLKEATETIRNLGITGIKFRSADRGTPRTPRIHRAPMLDMRGGRFIRNERAA